MAWDIRKILLPTDGSPLAELAIEPAIDIAKQKKAEIVALHVTEVPMSIVELDLRNEEFKFKEPIENPLFKIEEEAKKYGVKVKKIIEKGPVMEKILEVAEKENVDLIVMGTKGRSGTKKLLGSIADGVITYGLCPVLAVREKKLFKI
ncbi:MAG: universal stress protein [Euryarchaeota archaeon]|nr:universal stress protein [Euryarchaeota archaeon]